MKIKSFQNKRSFCFLILFLLVCGLSTAAQDFKVLRDGVEYAEYEREIDGVPVKMNLLRLDLTKVRLDVVHAMDAAIGLEKTSSIAARHGAFAAINAGFFRLDTSIFAGDASGILQIDGKLLSESYADRIALGIINGKDRTEVSIGNLKSEISFVRGVDETFAVSGINRERKKDEIVLFTPEFHRTTLTDSSGFELIVKGRLVEEIRKNTGSSIIPSNGFVISVSNEKYSKLSQKKNIIRLRKSIEPLEKSQSVFFSQAEDIVGGVPQLIKNGRIKITWEAEKSSKSFVETKHPRTAVAKLKDGKFLMVTIDGRSESSGGISLENLAKFLLELGATDAMNLDGGGSTTMFVDGKVVNKPSDKEGERRVSDAILVFPRAAEK